ncbi:hypothetical protein MRB53_036185 [Persea americana]|uniref:Uncharacterized protein n=1 Tax=Persea americana TaxID=3435 RepID=A0ACC2K792_PERAE|nr:hypothetical protein MRB53_036185 [Persea americana]
MDSSEIPFQDLNLAPEPLSTIPPKHQKPFIFPKIEPKLEPEEDEGYDPKLQLQNPNSPPKPSSSASEEADVYTEFLRISHLFRSAFAEKLRRRLADAAVLRPDGPLAIVPSAQSNPVSSAIVPASSAKPKRPRSGEMVRASHLGLHDQQRFRYSVRKTRLVYESLRLFLMREEDRAAGNLELGKRGRADLKSAAAMMDRGMWLNRDKRIVGHVPGIDVGDHFFFRIEMCVVGLHGTPQAGIDYVPASRTSSREPIATSIIVSGGYEDDEDGGDVIIYTGQGGKERHFQRHNVHQKLEGGNLALERSLHYGIEIRVIRGFKWDGSPTGKIYVYDGLYRVINYWLDVGKSGFGVYKYKLVRIAGQPDMGSVVMNFAHNLKNDPLSMRPNGYLSLDMSKGKEKLPVYLFNDVDGDAEPMHYDYLANPVYPPFTVEGSVGGGCDCVSGCSFGCSCIGKNGGELVYDSSGILLRGKPLIYECGQMCRCPPFCQNRVTQKGVKHQLEVFRSRETGWGVRSLDSIRAGAFICEYSGIVLTEQQAAVIAMNGDSLIHPNRFPGRWVEWGDISSIFPQYMRPAFPTLPQLNFAMDVSRMRNVACYFSHSSSPNVLVQFVLYDHCNALYPHLMLFAMENIPPLRELSIDYGLADGWTGKLSL